MTILHSCCCWKSVRKGSFACGIYSTIYYTIIAANMSATLHEELKILRSNGTYESVLENKTPTEVSIIFTTLLLVVTSCGILSCCLLLYGLYMDNKYLLLPWIPTMIAFIFVDLCSVLNFFVSYIKFNPSVAILITFDFFLNVLNVYALLCVISQYQELKAGRGRAVDDLNLRVPNIQYSAQPTATSYLSTRKAVTYHETRPTPTHSPSGTAPSLGIEDTSPSSKTPRKSVKFPDNGSSTQNGSQLLDPWTIDVKSPMLLSKATDTSPLIDSVVEPVLQTKL